MIQRNYSQINVHRWAMNISDYTKDEYLKMIDNLLYINLK